MKPLVVYLDTQDYVRLYQRKDEVTTELYSYLLEKVKSKEIEIYFSFVIVSEFLTAFSPEYEHDRNERVKVLNSLCNKHCFRFPTRWHNDGVFSDDGDWLPAEISFFKIVDNLIREKIDGFLSQPMNRKQRRKIDPRFPLKHLIKENPAIYRQTLKEKGIKYPLPGELLHTNNFTKYLCGEYPEIRMRNLLDDYLKDLKIFNQIWHKHTEYSNFLFEMLTPMGKPYIELVGVYRSIMEKSLALRDSISPLKTDIKSGKMGLELATVYDGLEKLSAKIERLSYDELKDDLTLAWPKIVDIPEDFLVTVLAYVKESFSSNRKLLQSDGGDLLHAFFLPHADIWRGDRAFSFTLVNQKVPGYEKIVGRLDNIRDAIDEKLANRFSFNC